MINEFSYGQTGKNWPSTLSLSLYSTFKQWLIGRNREKKTEIEKFHYLENEKSFLDEIKFFIVFEGLSFAEK